MEKEEWENGLLFVKKKQQKGDRLHLSNLLLELLSALFRVVFLCSLEVVLHAQQNKALRRKALKRVIYEQHRGVAQEKPERKGDRQRERNLYVTRRFVCLVVLFQFLWRGSGVTVAVCSFIFPWGKGIDTFNLNNTKHHLTVKYCAAESVETREQQEYSYSLIWLSSVVALKNYCKTISMQYCCCVCQN